MIALEATLHLLFPLNIRMHPFSPQVVPQEFLTIQYFTSFSKPKPTKQNSVIQFMSVASEFVINPRSVELKRPVWSINCNWCNSISFTSSSEFVFICRCCCSNSQFLRFLFLKKKCMFLQLLCTDSRTVDSTFLAACWWRRQRIHPRRCSHGSQLRNQQDFAQKDREVRL